MEEVEAFRRNSSLANFAAGAAREIVEADAVVPVAERPVEAVRQVDEMDGRRPAVRSASAPSTPGRLKAQVMRWRSEKAAISLPATSQDGLARKVGGGGLGGRHRPDQDLGFRASCRFPHRPPPRQPGRGRGSLRTKATRAS